MAIREGADYSSLTKKKRILHEINLPPIPRQLLSYRHLRQTLEPIRLNLESTMPGKFNNLRKLDLERLQPRELFAADVIQPAIPISPGEQLLVELTNRARAHPLAEAALYSVELNDGVASNETISSTPKAPLAPISSLQLSAERHSADMIARDYFGHDAPSPAPHGVTRAERAAASGYLDSVGENISFASINGRSIEQVIEEIHRNLILSAGHRVNMMTEGYDDLGVGLESGLFTNGQGTFDVMMVTESYGLRSSSIASLTGVLYSDALVTNRFYTIGEQIANVKIVALSAEGDRYETTTSESGGYTLRLPQGAYRVTAEIQNGLPRPMGTISILASNVKLDLISTDAVWEFDELDTDFDNVVGPLDVLRVINYINSATSDADVVPMLDVDGDSIVSPLDVLMLVNHVNNNVQSGGEAEFTEPISCIDWLPPLQMCLTELKNRNRSFDQSSE